METLNTGEKVTLTFKEGATNQQGQPTIISKCENDGRIALLHMEHFNSKLVTAGSTWECIVSMTFPKKIIVKAIDEIK